uniref:Uncharacterized protein n=1 Tax=Setaria italica TaxID=4555 RepID=K3YKT8_SETIT
MERDGESQLPASLQPSGTTRLTTLGGNFWCDFHQIDGQFGNSKLGEEPGEPLLSRAPAVSVGLSQDVFRYFRDSVSMRGGSLWSTRADPVRADFVCDYYL